MLRSDSLEYYGDEGRAYFIGNVDYTEPRLTLKSEFLTYFQREERILATLNVDAKLPSGSNLEGPATGVLALDPARPRAARDGGRAPDDLDRRSGTARAGRSRP